MQKEIGQELDVVKSKVRGRGAVRSALRYPVRPLVVPDGSRCLSFRFWRDVRLVLAGLLAFRSVLAVMRPNGSAYPALQNNGNKTAME